MQILCLDSYVARNYCLLAEEFPYKLHWHVRCSVQKGKKYMTLQSQIIILRTYQITYKSQSWPILIRFILQTKKINDLVSQNTELYQNILQNLDSNPQWGIFHSFSETNQNLTILTRLITPWFSLCDGLNSPLLHGLDN